MSFHEYEVSRHLALADVPFYALIMAAIRQADSDNLKKLERAWPERVVEFRARYHAPGGLLPGEYVAEFRGACSDLDHGETT